MIIYKRKGITLAEVVVVLAVIAIVSMIVVSFTMMVNRKSLMSNAKADVVGEIRLVEKVVDTWIGKQESSGATFVVDNNELTAIIGESVYRLYIEDNKILGNLPNGESISYDIKKIDNISFEKIEKGTDEIFFCTLDYHFLEGLEEDVYSYIFCVNEYVGDILE